MARTFAEKSTAAFRQIVFMIMAVLGLAGFLFFKIYQKVYSYAGVLIHKVETACGCASMTQLATMHPLIFVALGVLSLIILAFLSYAVYKLVKLAVQTRKFTAQYLINAKLNHSSKLKRIIMGLNLAASRIIEIRESKPVVFCFGLRQPKVCLASGLIKMLRPDELEAVLAHEHHHMISREPAKLFVIKYWQSVFGWLPGIKTLINKYVTFSELAADEQATGNFTDKLKLARALFKIAATEEKQLLRAGLALSFFSSVIAERVNKLSDDAYAPRFKLWGQGFLISLGSVIFGLLAVFIFLSDSSQALAMHNNASCILDSGASQSTSLICAAGHDGHQATARCDRD